LVSVKPKEEKLYFPIKIRQLIRFDREREREKKRRGEERRGKEERETGKVHY
jgi:hypothetical protein